MMKKRKEILVMFLLIDMTTASGTNKNITIDSSNLWMKWGRPFDCEEGFVAVNYENEKPVKGACVPIGYDANHSPNDDSRTNIFVSFNHQKVLGLNEKDKTIIVEVKLSRMWADHRIKTVLESEGLYINLHHTKRVPKVWIPFIFISNMKEFVYNNDPFEYTELRFLRDSNISKTLTVLNYTVELRNTVYCDFDLEPFPFDIQKCQNSFYIMETDKVQMRLYDPFGHSLHSTKSYKGAGFVATVNFWMNENTMGLDIELKRLILPYLLQYYLPCFFIVMISFIGFIVPLSSIPGRVGLMVTQFLTLTNIFMHQIVSISYLICQKR